MKRSIIDSLQITKRYTFRPTVFYIQISRLILLIILLGGCSHQKKYEATIVDTDFASLEDSIKTMTLGTEPGELRIQNDDIGVILWGPNDRITLSVGKSDIWDRRMIGNKPITLKQIRDVLILPESDKDDPIAAAKAIEDFNVLIEKSKIAYNYHDFPCPKPAGQLILGLPFMHEGESGKISYKKGEDGTFFIRACNNEKIVEIRLYVHNMQNLIVLDGKAVGLDNGDFWVRVYRHWDTIKPGEKVNPSLGNHISPNDFERMDPPISFHEGDIFGVIQDYPAELTFPEGFRSVFASSIEGTSVNYEFDNQKRNLGTPMIAEKEGRIDFGTYKRFTPINEAQGAAATAYLGSLNGSFRILATVITTQDNIHPEIAAVQAISTAKATSADALRKIHNKRLEDFQNGIVKAPNKIRPAGYYGDIGLSCVASTKFSFQDSQLWHGDFHFNDGPQKIPLPRKNYSTIEPFFQILETILPIAKRQAKIIYGCSGAAYPLVHFPIKSETFLRIIPWDDSPELGGGLMRQVWKRFLYNWDLDYLKQRGYPMMREVARFYADYVTKSEDGVYHIIPSISSEHWGYKVNFELNKDSNASLAMFKYHLLASVRAATILGVDSEEKIKWEEIANNLAPYPLFQTPEGPIFVDVAGAPPRKYNIDANLACIWLTNDVGLDSSPELLEIARRTYNLINTDKPHSDIYKKQVAPRLGIFYPEAGIMYENLIQSQTGIIRVFPAVPKNKHLEFQDYLAEGAFEVSAKWYDSMVSDFTIHSMAGQDCFLVNPWKGKKILVTDLNNNIKVELLNEWNKYDNEYISFKTLPGGNYLIEPKH